jgi:signal transduction histidine kinase
LKRNVGSAYTPRKRATHLWVLIEIPEKAEEQLELVRGIARQTLSFYRQQHREHDVDLIQLLESALRIHTKYLLEKLIDIQRRFPETLVMRGNSAELLQVLSNVIVNALESLSQHGKLYLRARSGKDEIHVTVADNGSGIPEESRERLFVPFKHQQRRRWNGPRLMAFDELGRKACWKDPLAQFKSERIEWNHLSY